MQLNKNVIQNLDIPQEYKKILEEFCNKLIKHEKSITGIVLIGSASRSGEFVLDKSDLDICIYSDQILEYKDYSKSFLDSIRKYSDKIIMSPRYIEDYMGKRIELCVSFGCVIIDITWLPTTLPLSGESFYDIPQDFLELHIASLYIHGKLLYGELPNKENILKNYFPYYDEKLRGKRIEILEKMIYTEVFFLQKYIDNKDSDIFCCLVKIRKIFFQWLFVSRKKYLVSYEKNIKKQLDSLNLPISFQKDILCIEGKDIFEISQRFLDTLIVLLSSHEL